MATQRRSRLWPALLSMGLILVACAILYAFPHTQAGASRVVGTPVPREVTYCAPQGVPLPMDLYVPETGDSATLLAVLFVHGGGWSSGDKRSGEGAPEIAALTARGYLVAAINYRLAPQYHFPAQIEDVKCAVRYLRAHAQALHLDPQRIGAWGTSAGGHLVSLLGLTGPGAGMDGTGGYADQSSQVQAVVDMYGRADLSHVPSTRPDLLPIIGGKQNLARYSPVTYVHPDAPPFLIMHGDRDTIVPLALSQEFAARLRAAGVPATLVIVKNAEHSFVPTGPDMTPSRSEISRMVGDFFDRYLKGGAGPAAACCSFARKMARPGTSPVLQFVLQ